MWSKWLDLSKGRPLDLIFFFVESDRGPSETSRKHYLAIWYVWNFSSYGGKMVKLLLLSRTQNVKVIQSCDCRQSYRFCRDLKQCIHYFWILFIFYHLQGYFDILVPVKAIGHLFEFWNYIQSLYWHRTICEQFLKISIMADAAA